MVEEEELRVSDTEHHQLMGRFRHLERGEKEEEEEEEEEGEEGEVEEEEEGGEEDDR